MAKGIAKIDLLRGRSIWAESMNALQDLHCVFVATMLKAVKQIVRHHYAKAALVFGSKKLLRCNKLVIAFEYSFDCF